ERSAKELTPQVQVTVVNVVKPTAIRISVTVAIDGEQTSILRKLVRRPALLRRRQPSFLENIIVVIEQHGTKCPRHPVNLAVSRGQRMGYGHEAIHMVPVPLDKGR